MMLRQATTNTRKALDSPEGTAAIDGSGDSPDICVRVDVLGGLRVRAGGRVLGPRELGGPKARHVLLALLLNRGAPVSKDQLVSLVWGECAPHSAKATLEAYVCVLRKALRPRPGAQTQVPESPIKTVAGGYTIDMGCVDLDLARYEHLMSAALRPDTDPTDALPMLQHAMALARSPLLPEEASNDWLDEVRSVHSQNVHHGLVAAANKVAGLPSHSAEQWARLALAEDPFDESAWGALLHNLETHGQHARGVQTYDRCRSLFAAELGCAPGPGLQALYVRLLRGANEDDEELSQLLDAVVRLHRARRLGIELPELPGDGKRETKAQENGQSRSVEQACTALDQLLRTVGGRSPH
jgi:DNA-binding SARP family transcriptional activator